KGDWEKRKSKRVPVLDDKGNQMYNEKGWKIAKSVKVNDWDSTKKLNHWRENWSELLNEKSKEYGLKKTYSHKSFEDQGRLEKAEIRLTRSEYQFEKRQKDSCEKNGLEYKPTTYYAEKNEEIKAYNRKINHVIHLQDYKVNKNFNDIFDRVRKDQPHNEERIEATRKMVERAKGYIDYPTAKNLYNDFHSETSKWKLKLKRDVTALNAKKEFYNNLIHEYAKDKNAVIKYGYSADGLEREVAKDLNDIGDRQLNIQQELNKFNGLKAASEKTLNSQKVILQSEFSAIYGNVDSSLTDDEKNYAIQLMKDYQICLPEDKIKEEYLHSDKENENQYAPAWEQAKDTVVSHNIYNRTLKKLENESVDKLTATDRKDNEIKYRTFTNLKSS